MIFECGRPGSQSQSSFAVAGGWWVFLGPAPPRDVPVMIDLVETLRADRLGAYGYTVRRTLPVLDALAEESVVFDQAYAPAPWTVPAVASLIASASKSVGIM